METTKLSSKGQVIIPKSVRNTHHWDTGQELLVIDTDDGVLLKPKTPFPPTTLTEVAGMLHARVTPQSDEEIAAAIAQDLRNRWRDRD